MLIFSSCSFFRLSLVSLFFYLYRFLSRLFWLRRYLHIPGIGRMATDYDLRSIIGRRPRAPSQGTVFCTGPVGECELRVSGFHLPV